MAAPGERALAAELLAGIVVVWVSNVRRRGAAPSPTQFVGFVGSIGALSAVAMISPGVAKVCGGLGALLVLTLLVGRSADLLGAVNGAVGSKSPGTPTALLDATPAHSIVGDFPAAGSSSSSAGPAPAPSPTTTSQPQGVFA